MEAAGLEPERRDGEGKMKKSRFWIWTRSVCICFLLSGCNALPAIPNKFSLSEKYDTFTNTRHLQASKTFNDKGWPIEFAFTCERKDRSNKGKLNFKLTVHDKDAKTGESDPRINHILLKFDDKSLLEASTDKNGNLNLSETIRRNLTGDSSKFLHVRVIFGYGPGASLDSYLKFSGNSSPRSPQITHDASIDLEDSAIRRVTRDCPQ